MVFRAVTYRRRRNKVEVPQAPADASALDIAFYRSFYADLAGYDDEAAQLHWERHGRTEGRASSLRALIVEHPNFSRLPNDFSPLSYVFHNQDIGRTSLDAVTATRHYLDFGLEEGRRYGRIEDEAFVAAFRAHNGPPVPSLDPRLAWEPGNVEEYLFMRGFSGAGFLPSFDHPFYADVAGLPRPTAATANDAIFHFAEVGVAALLPIAEELVFDAAFVRRRRVTSSADAGGLGNDVDLYRSWLSIGDFDANPASHMAHMHQRFGVACTSEGLIDLKAYRLANADLGHMDDDALLEHVFGSGLDEKRSSLKITPANLPFFLQHVTHLERTGALDKAERTYRRLAHFVPAAPRLNQQFGDFLLRNGRETDAYDFYRRNIEAGVASRWGFLNAASCCERVGDLGGALDALAGGHRTYGDDLHIRRRWEATAERFFADELGFARALAMAGRIGDAQDRLYAAALRCHAPAESAAPPRAIRTVALFANTDLSQCTLYRVEQKVEQLALAGYAVRVYDWHRDRDAFKREVNECEAAIFYRVAAFPAIARVIEATRAAGIVTFYEIDDLVFDAAEFPEPLDAYAGQLTQAEHVELCLGAPLFRRAMELCDFAIASTPALAARMEPFVRCRRAFVHRNALGARHERAVAGRVARAVASGPVTIFYGSGTKAHKRDFETILLPALERIESRFGDKVRFVFAGHRPRGTASAVLAKATFVPFTPDVGDYWSTLSQADICLSVLRRSATNDAKSEIKWLEAAMFGLPAVVSRTASFETAIADGVTGCLAEDADGFTEALARLVADPDHRRRVGQAALAKARRDYDAPTLAANLKAIMDDVQVDAPQRLRVLVVNVFYPPQAKGGATRVVVDNIRDLRRLHPDTFDFEVFATQEGAEDPYSLDVYAFEGVRVTAMATSHYPDIDQAPTDPRAKDCFRRCVERFAPDLIHFHCVQRITAAAAEVAQASGIPYIITVHDGWWISSSQFLHDEKGPASTYAYDEPPLYLDAHDGRSSYGRPARLRPILEGAAAVLAVSDSFAETYRRAGLPHVRALANGVPTLDLDPVRSDRRPHASGKVRIAHLGGLEAHKGLPLLKRAILVARPKHLALTIVDLAMDAGDERLENWAGTPVRVVSRQPQETMGAIYRDIDVLFAPSLWPESFGLVTREAINAGCWVVASDRGAIGEPVEEDVNGHVVSVEDASGLVAVLQRIDADSKRYGSPPAWRPVQRTSEDQAAELAILYRSIVGGTRAAEGKLAAE